MSRGQNAGRSHSMKADNSSIDCLQIFGNDVNRSIYYSVRNKEDVGLRNVCYHSGQIVLYSSLLTKNVRIKIYKV
jgi:hypothetical protein